jgi:hypothetical protein
MCLGHKKVHIISVGLCKTACSHFLSNTCVSQGQGDYFKYNIALWMTGEVRGFSFFCPFSLLWDWNLWCPWSLMQRCQSRIGQTLVTSYVWSVANNRLWIRALRNPKHSSALCCYWQCEWMIQTPVHFNHDLSVHKGNWSNQNFD